MSAGFSTEQEVALYADSINTVLPLCKEVKSMVYSLGDYSFQVSKFLQHGETVLYVEHGNSGEYGSVEKRFYIENRAPVLLMERSTDNTKAIKFSKTYFREGRAFTTRERLGMNEMEIRDASYKGAEPATVYYRTLETYEDAINQRRKFDLVFEEIAECPKAKYLILSRKEINSYRAPIKVEVEDEFIHELYSNPLRYRGEKLDITWRMNANNEAVYSYGKLKTRD